MAPSVVPDGRAADARRCAALAGHLHFFLRIDRAPLFEHAQLQRHAPFAQFGSRKDLLDGLAAQLLLGASDAAAKKWVDGDVAQLAVLEEDPLIEIVDERAIVGLAGAQGFLGVLAFADVDDGAFEDFLAILDDQTDVFEDPDGCAVGAAQANLVVAERLLFAHAGEEFLAHALVEIELHRRARQHFRAGEAEQAGEGVVAIEDAAVAQGAEAAGEIALPELAIAFLGAQERLFELSAFGQIEGDAAEHDVAGVVAEGKLGDPPFAQFAIGGRHEFAQFDRLRAGHHAQVGLAQFRGNLGREQLVIQLAQEILHGLGEFLDPSLVDVDQPPDGVLDEADHRDPVHEGLETLLAFQQRRLGFFPLRDVGRGPGAAEQIPGLIAQRNRIETQMDARAADLCTVMDCFICGGDRCRPLRIGWPVRSSRSAYSGARKSRKACPIISSGS